MQNTFYPLRLRKTHERARHRRLMLNETKNKAQRITDFVAGHTDMRFWKMGEKMGWGVLGGFPIPSQIKKLNYLKNRNFNLRWLG